MPRTITQAQRAAQITFVLKGHLKNVRISYVRAAALLAKVRDEKLYRALKHDSMESYAAERLGLQRTSLYRYLQIYDWLRRSHREWLAPHPKGFIPELSDAYGVMWIEGRLEDTNLEPQTRTELEALRRKALVGKLTKREIEEFRARGRKRHDTLRALAASLQALRRWAEAFANAAPGSACRPRFRPRSPKSRIWRTRQGHAPRKSRRDTARSDRRKESTRVDLDAPPHREVSGRRAAKEETSCGVTT